MACARKASERPAKHVRRFKTETEAKYWISRKSKAWLKKRGYGDALIVAASSAQNSRT
jgi:hypothetical protein